MAAESYGLSKGAPPTPISPPTSFASVSPPLPLYISRLAFTLPYLLHHYETLSFINEFARIKLDFALSLSFSLLFPFSLYSSFLIFHLCLSNHCYRDRSYGFKGVLVLIFLVLDLQLVCTQPSIGYLVASMPSFGSDPRGFICSLLMFTIFILERYVLFLVRAFNFLNSPTTSILIQEHSNAKISGVYKYPVLVMVKTQLHLGLDISAISFQPSKYLFSSNCSFYSDPCVCLCIGGMSTSPTSVLEASFQCEAVPICLEDRPSIKLENALRRTLAGRLLTTNRPSIPNLTLAVSRLWNCPQRVSVYDHGKCLYSFEFTFAPDVDRVVSGGPWYVNGDMLLISRMNPNQAIEQLPFSFTKLWVRCFDLPPMCFTQAYAEAIGNSLGKFCEADLPPEDPNEAMLLVMKVPTVRKYLRVKFDFNLYGPLKSSQSIKVCNAKKIVVAEHISRLTYERLPQTCLRCGFLGHLVGGCAFDGPLLYGEWIRAERFFRINQVAIPKAVSIPMNSMAPSSSAGPQATQVTNIAELVNSMINDPSIVRADYSSIRAAGPLPISKGKAPMVESPKSSTMVPFKEASPPKCLVPVFGAGDSCLGSVPSYLRALSSPMGSESIMVDSDEGHFVSYLNSIASHENAYGPNTNRCLFNPESSSRDTLSPIKVFSPPPPRALSPIISEVARGGLPAAQISEVFKEEIQKLPVSRKRATGNPQTPRPKRGRQPNVSEEPG